MTTINGLSHAISEQPDGTRLADPANQRESWLRQMELAQLTDMQQARGPRGAAPPPAARPAATARATAATAPLHSQAAAPAREAAPPPARHANNDAPATRAGVARQPTAAVALPPVAPTLTLSAAVVAGAGIRAPGAVTGPGAQHAPLAAIAMADGGAPAQLADAVAESDALPGTEAPLHEVPKFQKQMLHLTGSGDDVTLWIRDSALTQAQSLALVQRLAGDMASAGLRLKGASVNGKPAHDTLFDHSLTPIPTPKDHHGA